MCPLDLELPSRVSVQDVRAFQREGVIALRQLFAPETVARLSSAVDHVMQKPSPLAQNFARSASGSFHSDMYLSAQFELYREFTPNSGLGEIAARLLTSSRVFLFNDEILIKSPNTERETPWHHDYTYWPLRGEKVCSLWVPLDPTDVKNGGMEFYRGSHQLDAEFHPRNFDTGEHRQTSSAERSVETLSIPREDVISYDVEPGDAIVFHARTLHKAYGNTHPTRPRRAAVFRLIGDDVRFDPRPRTIPVIWAPALTPGQLFEGSELFPLLFGS